MPSIVFDDYELREFRERAIYNILASECNCDSEDVESAIANKGQQLEELKSLLEEGSVEMYLADNFCKLIDDHRLFYAGIEREARERIQGVVHEYECEWKEAHGINF
jgi:hypothetical protein